MLLGLGTAGVLAQDGPGKPPGGSGGDVRRPAVMFQNLDKNGDGKISKDEAPERLALNFDKFDANHDGFITLEEFKAAIPPGAGSPGGSGGSGGDVRRPAVMFQNLDKNGDGKISRDEAPERLALNFDKFDANKDGFITP